MSLHAFIKMDRVLGSIDTRDVVVDLFDRLKSRDDSFLIEGDFFNLRAVNDCMQRSEANDFMRITAGIYQQELAGISPDILFTSRAGRGDEVSILISGIEEGVLEEALTKAQEKVARFVEKTGLTQLRHRKYPERCGAGLSVAKTSLSVDDDYDVLSASLQKSISDNKSEQGYPADQYTRDPEGYHNSYAAGIYQKAFEDWSESSSLAQEAIGSIQTDFDRAAADFSAADVRPKDKCFDDLRALPLADNDFSFMRCDVVNMGLLNKHFDSHVADTICADMAAIIQDEVGRSFEGQPIIYEMENGVVDVIIPSQDPQEIAAFKHAIHQRVYDEVLSNPVSDIPSGHQFADIAIGDIGVGLVMTDVKIKDNKNLAALMERTDCQIHVLKMHDVAFVMNEGEGQILAYPVGQGEARLLDNREQDKANNLPWARSLQTQLDAETTIKAMTLPVGLATQRLYGVDLSEPLQRHFAMKHLISEEMLKIPEGPERDAVKTDLEEEILANSNTMAEFDRWIADKYPDFDAGRLNLLDRPEVHTFLHADLMSMNISERWGFLSADLSDIVLQGQLVARTGQIVLDGGTKRTVQDSIGFTASAIRTGFEGEADIASRTIQFAKESAELLGNIENIKPESEGIDGDVHGALVTLIGQGADAVARKAERLGEVGVSEALHQMDQHPEFASYERTGDPIAAISTALTDAMHFVTDTDIIPPDFKEKITSKIQGLQVVAESFPLTEGLQLDRHLKVAPA